MEKNEFQAKMMFYILLKSLDEIEKVDEEFREEIEDFEAKIQWKILNFNGYQIFKDGKYSFSIDKEIEDPDVTMIIKNVDKAKAIFSGELDGTSAYMGGDLAIEGDLQVALQYGSLTDFIEEYLEPIRPR